MIDGDTVQVGAERIRLKDLDAQEIGRAQCDAERRLGLLAKRRLVALLSGPARVERTGAVDRYGRTLARIYIGGEGGESVAAVLIREGYARAWTGRRRSWCD